MDKFYKYSAILCFRVSDFFSKAATKAFTARIRKHNEEARKRFYAKR